MKTVIQHARFGEIVYSEDIWIGKKSISVGGYELQKVNKTTFVVPGGPADAVVYVKGNLFTGVSLSIMGEEIRVTPATKWYEYVMSALMFMLIMIWSNVPALFNIIPVVGGAIGGVISGLFIIFNIIFMKKTTSVLIKIAIWLVMTALMFAACYLVAVALLSVLI
jgi:hypothetical protein